MNKFISARAVLSHLLCRQNEGLPTRKQSFPTGFPIISTHPPHSRRSLAAHAHECVSFARMNVWTNGAASEKVSHTQPYTLTRDLIVTMMILVYIQEVQMMCVILTTVLKHCECL